MVPRQLPQDLLPVGLPLGKGFPQGQQQLFRLGRVVSLPIHPLDEKHLAGDAPLAFGDVALSLCKVFPFQSRVRHGRTCTQ